MPRLRWVAHPPPLREPAPPPAARRRRYSGPPGYGPYPPRWGFPAAVWVPEPGETAPPAPPVRRLRFAAVLAVTTAVLAVVAAGAEAWRFALLLAGRTQVLSGAVVRVNDALVTSAGLVLLVAAAATAAAAVPVLVRLHGDAARRSGRLPSRRPGEVVGWLLAPVANLYGAGVVVGEIDARLGVRTDDPEPSGGLRPSRLVSVWWAAWVLNGVLVLAALVRGSAGSLQALADTVELHVAVDLTAALVAGLGAAVLGRFARLLTPDGPPHPGWRIADPAPTRPAAGSARSPRSAPPAADRASGGHPFGTGDPTGPRPDPVPAVGAPGAP